VALESVAVCCSVFQMLHFVAECRKVKRRTWWRWRATLEWRPLLQCVAVCCSVLQWVTVSCSGLQCETKSDGRHGSDGEHCLSGDDRCSVLQCVAVCCSVLQCVAVCCSVLQCAAVCCSGLQCAAVFCSVLHCVAVCCSGLQWVVVCCIMLYCAAVYCIVLQRVSVAVFAVCRKVIRRTWCRQRRTPVW